MARIDEIMKKYDAKLNMSVESEENHVDMSKEYGQFKSDMMPELSRYERWARNFGSIAKFKLAQKDSEAIQKKLDMASLEVTPSQVMGLAVFSGFLTLIAGLFFAGVIFFFTNNLSLLFIALVFGTAIFLFYYFYSMPERLVNAYRLKASSQMVPAVLYIVAYMKHTSNLERAIAFASQHVGAPLSLELKKVFWDIETGKYSGIKESLDSWLEKWRESNMEFVESIHLIESSLYEPSEERRVLILEKSLQIILDGVYEKMLSYSREIRSPLTSVYMLGIVLPTLAMALLPLAATLLGGALRWYHVFLLFDLIVPFLVFYLTSQVLLKRPGGYGESEIMEMNPNYKKFIDNESWFLGIFVLVPFLIVGALPFIFNYLGKDFSFEQLGLSALAGFKFFDFRGMNPFGLGAVLLSLFIPLGIALFFSFVYDRKTKELIKSRNDSKNLENEFTNSLFQLGNRLGDGMPAEIAFAHIAESTRGQVTEGFFRAVNLNIQQNGMSLENAIFNTARGAIADYPSSLIATSMKILVESVKKGLNVAARSLMSISEYLKNIHKINERVRDLLAEVVSDMKSNMVFLAPLLSGIVVGLGTMITLILTKLSLVLGGFSGSDAGIGSLSGMIGLFSDVDKMIPPYYIQLAIGIYIVEITFILTSALVTVDAGTDRLRSVNETGKNLRKSLTLYTLVALIATIALSFLSSIALRGLSSING